ncbi:hypothetical protein Aple_082480 [Acrocarpospora pleiomorpha]|uniref:Uncharacterized protein n=1 Tax=Acrocarpospora pleiomorpha TaxID=90975 RepID=A0A5M3XZH0_9ACTN|nr:hypothetical protein [Acrocarpospora pleiomorpha]GES25349.1 hypothetical protein Aple_082480 [Acrocarpospora pleiomorpha]
MDVEVRDPDREETTAAELPANVKGKLFHRHEWLEIERIGNVVTSQCLCGKSKTRVKY